MNSITNPFADSEKLLDAQDKIEETTAARLAAIEASKKKPASYERKEEILKAISASLKARGLDYPVKEAEFVAKEPGSTHTWIAPSLPGADWHFEISEDYERLSSFRSRPTGRYSVVVGDYGNKKRFPQRKDGTHNYGEIAAEITWRIEAQKKQVQMRNVRKENEELSKKLRTELTGKPYTNPYPLVLGSSAYQNKPISAKFEVDLPYDEAKRLCEVLKREGFIK